jgi:hypothetical protein
MFGAKTMRLIKPIEVGEATRPDGIYFDPFNERVYASVIRPKMRR